MAYLHHGMTRERLVIACHAIAASRVCLNEGLPWLRQRKVKGVSISSYQSNSHHLVEVRVQIQMARYLLESLINDWENRHLWSPDLTATLKYMSTEIQFKTTSLVMQLFGATGLLNEIPEGTGFPMPLAEALANSRIQMVYGGANEAMKDIIASCMDLD